LLVLPLDAVCNPDKPTEENWTSKTTTDDNPRILDASYFGWRSSYPANAGVGGNVCVANVVGGETFSPLFVHGLSFGPDPTGNLHQFNNWWALYQHVPLGVSYDPGAIMDGVGSFYYFVRNNVVGANPPVCGPANCSGCCDPSGTCVQGMLRNLVELVDRLVCFAGHQPMHIQSAQLANALGNAIPGITIAVTANA
jgi:hypothetical protein